MGRYVSLRALVVVVVVASGLLLAPAAFASRLYVSNSSGDSISPFSIGASGTLTPITCTACGTGTDSAPQGVAISPNGKFLYTADVGLGTVSPFHIRSGGSLSPITCTSSNCTTGNSPYWLAVTPNGRFLYATNFDGDTVSQYSIGGRGSLTAIACTGTSGANCDTGHGPEEPAISPDGKFLYVENGHDATVSAFSIQSNGTLTPVACSACATGGYPWASAFTPNGKFLYVLNDTSGSISPFSVRSDGSLTKVSCSTSDCAAGTAATSDANGGPYSLAMSPSGKFLYAVNNTDQAVYPYSVKSNGSLTPIACTPSSNCSTGAGSLPTAAAMSPDGKFLYVTDSSSNDTVVVFSVAHNGTLSPVTCSSSSCGGLNEDSTDTYGQSVVATPDQAPTAAFTVKTAPSGQKTTFNATTSRAASGQTLVKYAWTFGDGGHATSKTATVKHTYKTAGTYTVKLTVTDSAGCSTTLIFTGQTAYCNGRPRARTTRKIVIKAA